MREFITDVPPDLNDKTNKTLNNLENPGENLPKLKRVANHACSPRDFGI